MLKIINFYKLYFSKLVRNLFCLHLASFFFYFEVLDPKKEVKFYCLPVFLIKKIFHFDIFLLKHKPNIQPNNISIYNSSIYITSKKIYKNFSTTRCNNFSHIPYIYLSNKLSLICLNLEGTDFLSVKRLPVPTIQDNGAAYHLSSRFRTVLF